MARFALSVWILLGCLPATAQKQIKSSRVTSDFTIPFRLTAYNNLVVKAVLNGRDTVQLMLHTATSGVTLTDSARIRLTSITINGAVDSVKSWGGNTNASAFSSANSLSMGALHWHNLTVWSDQNSGQQTDGKFGLDLFEGNVVELDFTKHVLVIHAQLPPKHKGYNQLRLTTKNGSHFLKATCRTAQTAITHDFLLHSGYGGSILLDDQLVQDHQLDRQIAITGEKTLTDAYGHRIITKKGLLPILQIGQYHLKEVPVGFFSGMIGRQQLSVLGSETLKRFNWLIDVRRGWVYLKPNGLYQSPFGA